MSDARIHADEDPNDRRLVRLVELARHFAQAKDTATAAFYYEAAFIYSQDLRGGIQRLANAEACAWKAETAALENMHGTAVDWYKRALVADPLSEELRALYAAAVTRAQTQMAEFLEKLRAKP